MSAENFSDDVEFDGDDSALVAQADVLERSLSDRGVKTSEITDELSQEKRGDKRDHRQGQNAIEKYLEPAQSVSGADGEQTSPSGFSLLFMKGDLFSCPPTDSLAHCVSKDLRMGKGIAVLFKQKFAGVSELKAQACRIGEVAILQRDRRYIYYLITKAKYNDKPTLQSLESTLRSMKNHCVKFGVKRLSMPRIGCGLDKLVWSDVENKLRKVFGDTDITITIYSI